MKHEKLLVLKSFPCRSMFVLFKFWFSKKNHKIIWSPATTSFVLLVSKRESWVANSISTSSSCSHWSDKNDSYFQSKRKWKKWVSTSNFDEQITIHFLKKTFGFEKRSWEKRNIQQHVNDHRSSYKRRLFRWWT